MALIIKLAWEDVTRLAPMLLRSTRKGTSMTLTWCVTVYTDSFVEWQSFTHSHMWLECKMLLGIIPVWENVSNENLPANCILSLIERSRAGWPWNWHVLCDICFLIWSEFTGQCKPQIPVISGRYCYFLQYLCMITTLCLMGWTNYTPIHNIDFHTLTFRIATYRAHYFLHWHWTLAFDIRCRIVQNVRKS